MFKFISAAVVLSGFLLLFSNCQKPETPTATSNISTTVVSNLNSVRTDMTPDSLASNTALDVSAQVDPCQGVSDFAVCQSNLIRTYMQFAKQSVDLLTTLTAVIGGSLGEVPDSNSGSSTDGKTSWNKTSADVWSILQRGTNNDSLTYVSINNGVYTMKFDMSKSETEAADKQFEATVNFTDADNWTVDVFFHNGVCDIFDAADPSKVHIKIAKSSGLWTGKAMLYFPRWQAPNTSVNCSTAGSTITMYTDFVGNDTSTKAALYLIPSNVNTMASITNYDIPDFCTNFAAACGGAGEPTAGALAAYPNNWCTTGAGTNPTWGDNCASNTAVSGAAFSSASDWTTPDQLVLKTVTLPTSL